MDDSVLDVGKHMTNSLKKVPRDSDSTYRALSVSRKELLVDGSDSVFRQFIHDILAFSRQIQEVSSALGEVIGLSATQYLVLIAIQHHSRSSGIGVGQIANHLHLSGGFMTTEVNKLVAEGLVTKESNSADRRRVHLKLTPRAHELLRDLTAVQRPVNDVLFDSLSHEDFEKARVLVSGLLTGVAQALMLAKYLKNAGNAAPTNIRRPPKGSNDSPGKDER